MLETIGNGTFLATVMIFVFVLVNIIRQVRRGKLFEPVSKNVLICSVYVLVAGATAANGLFHFGHGILGSIDFPAPFAKIFGNGIFSTISNIIWGLFNFAVTSFIVISYRKSVPKWVFGACFAVGFVFIALMLRFVFLPGYYPAHAF